MIRIATIVEGDGEVAALPILLRRLGQAWSPDVPVDPVRPIRVKRDQFINKPAEFERQLLFASTKAQAHGWVLIVLDADDDCPKDLGQVLLERVRRFIPHRRSSVVLANREFEAWFIAAARSLGHSRLFFRSDQGHGCRDST